VLVSIVDRVPAAQPVSNGKGPPMGDSLEIEFIDENFKQDRRPEF